MSGLRLTRSRHLPYSARPLLLCFGIIASAGSVGVAFGQESEASERPEARAEGDERAKSSKSEKKRAKRAKGEKRAKDDTERLGRLEVGGRVFVRAALVEKAQLFTDAAGAPLERDETSLDLSVPSARLRAKYRAPLKWLSAEVEADFAGQPELKDAYIRARGERFSAQAGNFKLPFSAIELDSLWDLPLARRGFVHDLLVNRFEVAGRRPGVTFALRKRGGIRPELTLGAFQGSVVVNENSSDRDVELVSEQTLAAQSVVARATAKLDDVLLGAGYEHRVGSPAELTTEHYATANLDLTCDTTFRGGGFRVWAEGMLGESWFEHALKPEDGAAATFASGRIILGYRFGGVRAGDAYLEPYGMLALVDPDLDVAEDVALEEVLGINVGFWDLVRVGLEGEVVRVGRNFPRAVHLGRPLDRKALLLQASLAF